MTKPLRWGILGAAKFAREHMAPAMMLAKDTELVALATSSADDKARFRERQKQIQLSRKRGQKHMAGFDGS